MSLFRICFNVCLLALLWPRPSVTELLSMIEGGTAYIKYEGSLHGEVTLTTNHVDDCEHNGVTDFSHLSQSEMSIGINPDWDKNPLFFALEHQGRLDSKRLAARALNELSPQSSDQRAGSDLSSLGSLYAGETSDAVYNLYFCTSWFLCRKANRYCEELEFWPWYYEPDRTVDLNKATITRVEDQSLIDQSSHSGPYYSVVGDQSTWAHNMSMLSYNSFDFQRDPDYFEPPGCRSGLRFQWNGIQDFTYDVSFTNTTASATFTLSNPFANAILHFSGQRVDSGNGSKADSVSLSTVSKNQQPHFTLVDGSEISWNIDDKGRYDVASEGTTLSTVFSLWWVWMGTIIAAVL